jgi:hypothetical protein
MMTTNLFVIVNVKQLRTEGVLEFYCLFPNILGCWCPKFSYFYTNYDDGTGTLNSYGCIFHGTGNSAQLCQNFRISGGGCFEPPKSPRGTPLTVNGPYQPFITISYLHCLCGRLFNIEDFCGLLTIGRTISCVCSDRRCCRLCAARF